MNNQLTEGRIGSTLLRFAIPFMLASFIQCLYGAVDLFVVGQYTGSTAVSAVACGAQIMQTLTAVILGIATGGTVVLGIAIGARDERTAACTVGNLTILFLLVGAVTMPLMLLGNSFIVDWMQVPAEAVAEAEQYILVCSIGIPFILGYNGVSAIFRGVGDSRSPVIFVIVACIVNIAGDFLLTGWMNLGVLGAAVATTSAQGVGFLFALLYMKKRGLGFRLFRGCLTPRWELIGRILRVGLPIAVQDLLVNLSFLAITAIVNTLGLVASAGVGVAERIIGFAFLMPGGFAAAVATMAAQNIGANQRERGWKTMWYGIGFSLIGGAVMVLLFNSIPEVFSGIFSKDQAVVTASAQYLRTYALDLLLVAFVFCINSWFNATERAMISFLHSMAATFLMRIPATWFLSRYATESLSIMGLAAPLATIVSMIICAFFLRKDFREFRKITM